MVISPVHFPQYRFGSARVLADQCSWQRWYYSRGTTALLNGLLAIGRKRKKAVIRVWFPDYFCKEPLDVFAPFPIEVWFYPVRKSLEPDYQQCEARAQKESPPDALVLVHYFGFPNHLDSARAFCTRQGIELVEDCAHVLRPFGAVGTSGACASFSPWKLLPLPELGVLSAAPELVPFIESRPPAYSPMPLARVYVKREIQRLLCMMEVNWYRSSADSGSIPIRYTPAANGLAIALLARYGSVLEWVVRRRRQNYALLESFFKEHSLKSLLFQELPHAVVPYCFPYFTRLPAAAVSRALIQQGIPAYPWPTLPEKVKKDQASHKEANWLAKQVLLLPIHQNVSLKQLEYMKRVLSEAGKDNPYL